MENTMTTTDAESKDRNCFGLKEFCYRNGIGRTTAYKEIKQGRLQPKKVGKRTLISLEEEARWLAKVPVGGQAA
jgi:predicted site-specific integrase-resolvase